jgi:hypothetical protein
MDYLSHQQEVSPMPWPLSQDYNEAIQNPKTSFGDPELRGGEVVRNAVGIPLPRSGNFADVYEFHGVSGKRWAIKCFTREVPGLHGRYTVISKHLAQVKLPFMVDFEYLPKGMRIRGQLFPVLKMEWVDGFLLNEFVRNNVDKPAPLTALGHVWRRMAARLRESNIAHGDLQHGNVILVPGSKTTSLSLRLIDYDGMWVPALADKAPGEVGHPAYQHPQRIVQGTYSVAIDRTPLLVVACALRCLIDGGKSLWDLYDNGDNLLFREADLKAPEHSRLFADLTKQRDQDARVLLQNLRRGLSGKLEDVPVLDEIQHLPHHATPAQPPKQGPPLKATPVAAPFNTPASFQRPAPPASVPSPESVFAQATTGARTSRRWSAATRRRWIFLSSAGFLVLAIGLLISWALKPSRLSPRVPDDFRAENKRTNLTRRQKPSVPADKPVTPPEKSHKIDTGPATAKGANPVKAPPEEEPSQVDLDLKTPRLEVKQAQSVPLAVSLKINALDKGRMELEICNLPKSVQGLRLSLAEGTKAATLYISASEAAPESETPGIAVKVTAQGKIVTSAPFTLVVVKEPNNEKAERRLAECRDFLNNNNLASAFNKLAEARQLDAGNPGLSKAIQAFIIAGRKSPEAILRVISGEPVFLSNVVADRQYTVNARVDAAMVLGKSRDAPDSEAILQRLLKVLADKEDDPVVRHRALYPLMLYKEKLGAMPDAVAVIEKVIVQARAASEKNLRYECARVLALIQGPDVGEPTLSALGELLNEKGLKIIGTIEGGATAERDARLLGMDALKTIGTKRIGGRADLIKQLKSLAAENAAEDIAKTANALLKELAPEPPAVVQRPVELQMKKGLASISGDLTDADPPYKERQHHRVFLLQMEPGKSYEIEMESEGFDPYLYLEDPKTKVLVDVNNGKAYPKAQITHKATQRGKHRLVATTFDGNCGKFTLTVHELKAMPPNKPKKGDGTDRVTALFDGKELSGWNRNPAWAVEGGVLKSSAPGFLTTVRDDYKDFHLRVEVRLKKEPVGGVHLHLRFNPPTSFEGYSLFIGGLAGRNACSLGFMRNVKVSGNTVKSETMTGNQGLLPVGKWMNLEVIASGQRFKVIVNGALAADVVDGKNVSQKGRLGLLDADQACEVRSITIKDLGTAPVKAKP